MLLRTSQNQESGSVPVANGQNAMKIWCRARFGRTAIQVDDGIMFVGPALNEKANPARTVLLRV